MNRQGCSSVDLMSYEKWMEDQMESNRIHRLENPVKPTPRLTKSKSKKDLHILSISEIIFDNRQKIPENDYIQVMNHLKDLCNFPKS
jgi:hypothetical protein